MNYKFFLLSIIMIFGFSQDNIISIPPQELFLQANKLYTEEKFDQALELYNQIPHKSALVHYNLGNCAYKLKKYGQALLHWRRAETNWGLFNRAELTHNITLAKTHLNKNYDKKETEKNSFIVPLAEYCKTITVSFVRSIQLLYLQLIFLFVWIALFIIKRLPVAKRFKFAMIPLLLLLCIFGSMLSIKYGLRITTSGIVTVPKAIVRSGPGETFQEIMTVREGDEGSIKKVADKYYKVSFNGKLGWINSSMFEKI